MTDQFHVKQTSPNLDTASSSSAAAIIWPRGSKTTVSNSMQNGSCGPGTAPAVEC